MTGVYLVCIMTMLTIISVYVCAVQAISEIILNFILKVLMRNNENIYISYKLKREIKHYKKIVCKLIWDKFVNIKNN